MSFWLCVLSSKRSNHKHCLQFWFFCYFNYYCLCFHTSYRWIFTQNMKSVSVTAYCYTWIRKKLNIANLMSINLSFRLWNTTIGWPALSFWWCTVKTFFQRFTVYTRRNILYTSLKNLLKVWYDYLQKLIRMCSIFNTFCK